MIVSYWTLPGSHRGGLIRPRSVSRCNVLIPADSSEIRLAPTISRMRRVVSGFRVIDRDGVWHERLEAQDGEDGPALRRTAPRHPDRHDQHRLDRDGPRRLPG